MKVLIPDVWFTTKGITELDIDRGQENKTTHLEVFCDGCSVLLSSSDGHDMEHVGLTNRDDVKELITALIDAYAMLEE